MSELRQDPVSGDWVIIAPGRAARPKFLDAKHPARKPSPRSTCPFEHPEKNGNWPPFLAFPNEKNWRVMSLPNKFPALVTHGTTCSALFHDGIYLARTGIGEHDLVVTRDHNKNFSDVSMGDAVEIFKMFQKLCLRTLDDPCAVYAIPFFNWGPGAGASVWHPHYQFLSLPIIPAHAGRSLAGAAAYHVKKRRCVRCDMIAFERKAKKRIIGENASAIAFAPYASKFSLEISVMPKKHSPYFYRAGVAEIAGTVTLVRSIMKDLKRNANDPDLNLFIHEAPLEGKRHEYHHWHAELLPRTSIPAGVEMSTGIYINSTPPENVKKILRGKL